MSSVSEAATVGRHYGGHDVKFCEKLGEDLICSICMLAFRDPQQIVACGHQYCKSCLDSCKKAQGREFHCPQDRKPIDISKVFPNVASERKIQSLKVKCNNVNKDCEWIGELRSLKDHMSACQFEEIRCVSEGCQSVQQRRLVVDHLHKCRFRVVKCPYCEESYTQKDEKEHRKSCTDMPVKCENGCGKIIRKTEMRSHMDNDCPLETTSCTYAGVGCKYKCTRDKKDDHEKADVTYHLNLAMNRIQVLEDSHKVCVPADKRGILTYIWNIKNFQETVIKIHASCKFIYSKLYVTSEYGYEVRLRAKIFSPEVYRAGQWGATPCISVELEILKGSFDALLDWPFSYKYTLAFIQKDGLSSPNMMRSESALMVPIDELQKKGYLINNTVFIKLELNTNIDR